MSEGKQFQPVSARLGRAILKGAGIDSKRVVGCSLEIGEPGVVVLCVRVFLDSEDASKVVAAIAAVDPAVPEWR